MVEELWSLRDTFLGLQCSLSGKRHPLNTQGETGTWNKGPTIVVPLEGQGPGHRGRLGVLVCQSAPVGPPPEASEKFPH